MTQPSDPTNARAQAEEYYYAALDALARGDAETAIVGFEAVLALDATLHDARHGLIRALQEAGRYDEGISVAEDLAKLDPEDVLAHTALSILYQHKGLVPEAEAAGLRAKLLGWKQRLRAAKAGEFSA